MTETPSVVRYPNGFELVFLPNPSAPVLALDLWVRAGSVHERPGEEGLAHVVEHMLFKGTRRRPPGAIAREIEGVGGEINAFTSFDHTVYTLVVASRFAPLALDILADAVFGALFDPDELEREKRVVLEEIRRGRDLPQLYLSRMLFAEAFCVHPYGRPVIGWEESVQAFTPERCRAFVKRWYRPGNMVLVAAGDADPADLQREVGRLFGSGRAAGRPRRPRAPREPRPRGFRARFEARAVNETYFNLAFPGPSASHPDAPAVDLLVTVLGQGEASRLQHRVKLDRNLVRTVGAGAYTPRDPGLIYVSGVAEPARLDEALRAVFQELFRLCHEPVGTRELERARQNVEADFVYQKETVQGQAQKAGFFHLLMGRPEAEQEYLERLRRATADEVRAAARKYLRSAHGVLVALHPEGAPPPWSPEGAARLAADAEARARRTHRRSASARRALVRRRLSNGARVIVKVNTHVPLVAVRAAALGGLRREPAPLAGAFHVLASCWNRGTRSRNVFDIAHAIDALSGELEGFSGRNSFGIKAEFLSRFIEDGLDLVSEVLCHPSFPDEEVDKVREDTLASIRLRRDHPPSLAFRLFEEALYGPHPFGRDVLGREETVRSLTAEDLRTLYRAALRPEHLAVAVVGDVEPDRVFEFLERALVELEPCGNLAEEPAPPRPPREPVLRREPADLEQAHVVVGFLGARIQDPHRYALRVLNAVLTGQGGRLFRRLRDEMGLAYAVTSTCVEGLDPGYLAGYIATSPENVQQAREGLLAEMTRLAADPPAGEELEQAKRKLVGSFEIALQENQMQATQMALDEIYGLGYRGHEAFAKRVMAVTPDDVAEAARRHLRAEASVTLVLGPGD